MRTSALRTGAAIPALLSCLLAAGGVGLAYNQAPMLREKVLTGELPPVEERLPENPEVFQPGEGQSIGRYGGTLRMSGSGGDLGTFLATALTHYSVDTRRIVPDIASRVEISGDYRQVTFHIRRGIKWSDGEPLTTEDLQFWWEDIILNKELTPMVPNFWRVGEEMATFRKIDRYSFRIEYPATNIRLTNLFHGQALNPRRLGCLRPKHYLKKFHIKYNPDADRLAREAGYDHWWELFQLKADPVPWDQNLDLPRLSIWIPERTTPSYQRFVRNPYYWKVDGEGNQLPYIDRILITRDQDRRVLLAKCAFGQIDLAIGGLSIADYPLLKSLEKKAGIQVHLWPNMRGSHFAFAFNQNHPEPAKRQVFQDVRFRRAVSLAIDRDEINQVVYFGQAAPVQATVHPICPYYEERWALSYAQYDPRQANELLDEAGLRWEQGQKYRTGLDGQPFTLIWEYATSGGQRTDIVELLRDYFTGVGIKMIPKPQNGAFNTTRQQTGGTDIFSWTCGSPTKYYRRSRLIPLVEGKWGLPALEWHRWLRTEGREGTRPPEQIRQWYDTTIEWLKTDDDEVRWNLAREMFDFQAENLIWIGTVGRAPTPVVASDKLRNLSSESLWGWQTLFWLAHPTETYYLAK